jgi:predicted dienelactone hydrolase
VAIHTNLKKMITRVLKWKLFTLCLLTCVAAAAAGEYDPLSESASSEGQTAELIVKDELRQREIPLNVYLPAAADSAPVVLFSHGLGGTRAGCAYIGKHWSTRGYVVVFLQHPGSDDSVWKDAPLRKRLAAMQEAASPQNFLLRVRDVPAVLDQLEEWNKESQHVLAGRLDIQRVGMSGHSFGAVTTQAVSGQSFPPRGPLFTDARIKAAISLSPSSPRSGDPKLSFGNVKIPWLLITGTKDTSPIGGHTIESRMAVYPSLPGGIDKYELVLHNAEHSAFSDRALPDDREPRNPNHHRAILALSTAFWDAHLRNDDSARAWLHSEKGRSVLESQDRWQLQSHSQ